MVFRREYCTVRWLSTIFSTYPGVRTGLIILLTLVSSMTGSTRAQKNKVIRYVAIGDSYSIGEGATQEQSWPSLLARHLTGDGIAVQLVANPSATGWTTQQAIDRELPVFREAKPGFATLLIGVNDWVRGVTAEKFRRNLAFLMDEMLGVLASKERFLVVTIPDFSVTPDGPSYGGGRNISLGIASFNRVIKEEAARRGLRVVDIFPASQQARHDLSLVARDGLHPSAKAYAGWEAMIFPAVRELLKTAAGDKTADAPLRD